MLKVPLRILAALWLAAGATTATARDITDMTGRKVTVPDKIERVVTLGSVPVINSFIFAVGKAPVIVSGLPKSFVTAGRWKYQYVFAPQLQTAPDVQDSAYRPDIEKVLTVRPDVALTFEQASADLLTANGVPTVLLRIQTAEDIKNGVRLVGDLLGNKEIGDAYAAYFDGVLKRVDDRLASVPAAKRPKVLNMNPATMVQPHLVAEWWIKKAGGVSVTDDGRKLEVLPLTAEVVIASDPDIITLFDPGHRKALAENPTLAQLRAVKAGRVAVSPMGAHTWANRTVEQPLTVLWAATQFHPDLFSRAELVTEVRSFYHTFFRIDLSDQQIDAILSGEV
jgi:iron complex transport system substrate-binding protein